MTHKFRATHKEKPEWSFTYRVEELAVEKFHHLAKRKIIDDVPRYECFFEMFHHDRFVCLDSEKRECYEEAIIRCGRQDSQMYGWVKWSEKYQMWSFMILNDPHPDDNEDFWEGIHEWEDDFVVIGSSRNAAALEPKVREMLEEGD